MAAVRTSTVRPSGGGWSGPSGPSDAHDHVEVDEAAGLELGHLAVREPSLTAKLAFGQTELAGQVADDERGGAMPQHPGQGIPHDGGGVVVAVGVNRLAELGVVGAGGGAGSGRARVAALHLAMCCR